MRYTHAFFDLDGTVTNSAPGITRSVRYALDQLGIEPPPEEELTYFIGPPLLQSFCTGFGFTEEHGRKAIELYREYYRARGMLECTLYGGIIELIKTLHAHGVTLVLATCKPHVFAERILEHFGLRQYFATISGPELDGTRGEKHEVIAHALATLKIGDPKSVLMIGDRDNDVLGARHHGMDCVGAMWGFGSEEELKAAGAAYLCPTPLDVADIFGY